MRGREGAILYLLIFILTVAAGMLTATLWLVTGRVAGGSGTVSSVRSFYAAQSGLAVAKQKLSGLTTADRAAIEKLDGATFPLGKEGTRFALALLYEDPDGDPATADRVTITAAGFSGKGLEVVRRVATRMTIPPPATLQPLFASGFGFAEDPLVDRFFAATVTTLPHASEKPLASVSPTPGGDAGELFTLGSEPGGVAGYFRMTAPAFGDSRIMLHTGDCFTWPVVPGVTCDPGACLATGDCRSRQGLSIQPDGARYQNYFVKLRFKLLSGAGMGVYFRAGYSASFTGGPGAMSGYLWQYDARLGYFFACGRSAMLNGGDGAGMLATRRIDAGSETCGLPCGFFSRPEAGGAYPFFCPENGPGAPSLPGWGWQNSDWRAGWRTFYLYVYQGAAKLYLGREEVAGPGGEADPLPIGHLAFSDLPGPLATGDIGIRVWNGAMLLIDSLFVYPNDANLDPARFAG